MPKPSRYELPFPDKKIIRRLYIATGILLSIHVFLTIFHYRWMELPWLLRELFDVDEEESIPTWFSSSLLLVTAVTLYVIASLKIKDRDKQAVYWIGLGAGFTFLSADEIAGFHETLNSVMEISWAVPGLVIALIVGVAYLKFLSELPAPVAMRFVMAGAIFIGGAVGVELATEPFLYNDELDTLAYNLWTPVEEGMEMGGVIFFLATLFDYIRTTWQLSLVVNSRKS